MRLGKYNLNSKYIIAHRQNMSMILAKKSLFYLLFFARCDIIKNIKNNLLYMTAEFEGHSNWPPTNGDKQSKWQEYISPKLQLVVDKLTDKTRITESDREKAYGELMQIARATFLEHGAVESSTPNEILGGRFDGSLRIRRED